jgi:hypothetical protein
MAAHLHHDGFRNAGIWFASTACSDRIQAGE